MPIHGVGTTNELLERKHSRTVIAMRMRRVTRKHAGISTISLGCVCYPSERMSYDLILDRHVAFTNFDVEPSPGKDVQLGRDRVYAGMSV